MLKRIFLLFSAMENSENYRKIAFTALSNNNQWHNINIRTPRALSHAIFTDQHTMHGRRIHAVATYSESGRITSNIMEHLD
jgi:hypothetical protein